MHKNYMYIAVFHALAHIAKVFWIRTIRAVTRDFQQCGILTSVHSDVPVQSPFQLRNSNDGQSVA